MKKITMLAVALSALAGLCVAAFAGTGLPPITAILAKPETQVFGTLKNYFSSPTLSRFTLVKADANSGTLVARRDGVDTATWNSWTACSVGPMDMLDSLEDSSVLVTVRLRMEFKTKTEVTVTPTFDGTYGMGATNRHTIRCDSRGILENQILQAANGGVPPR